MADDEDLMNLPIEPVNVAVDQNVMGQTNFKISIPLKVHSNWSQSDDKTYEIKLGFRGPGGRRFG